MPSQLVGVFHGLWGLSSGLTTHLKGLFSRVESRNKMRIVLEDYLHIIHLEIADWLSQFPLIYGKLVSLGSSLQTTVENYGHCR